MTIDDFIVQSEKLFIEDEQASKEHIIKRIDNQRSNLVKMINQLDPEAERHFQVRKETVSRNIGDLYKTVTDSINLFLTGQFAESRQKIDTRFVDRHNTDRDPLPAKNIARDSFFFRMRCNDSYDLFQRKEMFHIPFEKRGTVTNQRFSISGYPCLYLGSSTYCCWEETNRPDIDTSNIVSLKNTRPLKFIDLSIPAIDPQLFNEYSIYQLVLPLACSLKVNNPDDSFKPEYIVPQNVLNCIVERNSGDRIQFDGIMYTSSAYGRSGCLFNEKERLINYVIPIKTSREKGLCGELVSLFQIAEPTSILIERLQRNERAPRSPIINENDSLPIYENTIWGVTEEQILEKEHEIIHCD